MSPRTAPLEKKLPGPGGACNPLENGEDVCAGKGGEVWADREAYGICSGLTWKIRYMLFDKRGGDGLFCARIRMRAGTA